MIVDHCHESHELPALVKCRIKEKKEVTASDFELNGLAARTTVQPSLSFGLTADHDSRWHLSWTTAGNAFRLFVALFPVDAPGSLCWPIGG